MLAQPFATHTVLSRSALCSLHCTLCSVVLFSALCNKYAFCFCCSALCSLHCALCSVPVSSSEARGAGGADTYNEHTKAALAEAGVTYCFAVRPEPITAAAIEQDPLSLPRCLATARSSRHRDCSLDTVCRCLCLHPSRFSTHPSMPQRHSQGSSRLTRVLY